MIKVEKLFFCAMMAFVYQSVNFGMYDYRWEWFGPKFLEREYCPTNTIFCFYTFVFENENSFIRANNAYFIGCKFNEQKDGRIVTTKENLFIAQSEHVVISKTELICLPTAIFLLCIMYKKRYAIIDFLYKVHF